MINRLYKKVIYVDLGILQKLKLVANTNHESLSEVTNRVLRDGLKKYSVGTVTYHPTRKTMTRLTFDLDEDLELKMIELVDDEPKLNQTKLFNQVLANELENNNFIETTSKEYNLTLSAEVVDFLLKETKDKGYGSIARTISKYLDTTNLSLLKPCTSEIKLTKRIRFQPTIEQCNLVAEAMTKYDTSIGRIVENVVRKNNTEFFK